MASGPLICRTGVAVLPPRLFPPSAYYAVMAQYPAVAIDADMRYDKRAKAVHRYRIADTRGPLELTVPVARPEGATTAAGVPWSAVGVSAHGRWWEVHRTALESAYGRTPFFEYYIDRLLPLFAPRPLDRAESASDLCLRADKAVRGILGLDTAIISTAAASAAEQCADMRRTMPEVPDAAYWQVRADRFGFIGGISILDLIFNMGPEAPEVLLRMGRKIPEIGY